LNDFVDPRASMMKKIKVLTPGQRFVLEFSIENESIEILLKKNP
jgi:hypothetical protein